jgi:phosphotransferase system enzyme I (PtsP)
MAQSGSTTFGSSRRLLKSLRELMVEETDTQTRLDHMVTQIANEMVADVCSIYLRRNDGTMELCATEGLSRQAVHNTRMKQGEGLVGLVAEGAEPIGLSDAPNHKRFSYRPETGEDPYQSFLGVPMLKGGRLIGVLVVQNRAAKTYPEDDVETLQTIATVFAEIVTTNDLSDSLDDFDIKPRQAQNLAGKTFSNGLVKGYAVLHAPEVAATRLLADNLEEEEARLNTSLRELRNGLEQLLSGQTTSLGAVPLEVLEMFLLLSRDRGWEHRLLEGVRAGLTAEAAVEQVRSEHRARMASVKDSYLRDRLHDLEELDNRLLRHLSGTNIMQSLGEDAILVARDIGPAELLEYANCDLKAVLLEEGSNSSHSAIIARAMGLPMIGQINGLVSQVANKDPIIVDGQAANIYLRYDPMVAEAFESRLEADTIEKQRIGALKDVPNITANGEKIGLYINAGLTHDMEQLGKTGADGIGLFRTEFQFMVANSLPRVDAQTRFYKNIIDNSRDLPVTFRTLDLGGDKIARFMKGFKEENPAMGWRALRLGLDRRAVLAYQLRAILRATEGKHLRIMFPLVSTVDEFLLARNMLLEEMDWAKKQGRTPPSKTEIGAMIEAPSIAWDVARIAKTCDFLSIGTNDLMQFFFAADRGSNHVNDRYDILSRPAISFLKYIKDNANGATLSVCGEHAGRLIEVLALIGLGYRNFSMAPTAIGIIKELILKIDTNKVQEFVTNYIEDENNIENFDLRNAITNFAFSNKYIM